MMGLGLAFLFLLLLLTRTEGGDNKQQQLPPVDPESRLYARMAGLVVPYGYPLEEHFVETVSALLHHVTRCHRNMFMPAGVDSLLYLAGGWLHPAHVQDTSWPQ